LHHDFDFSATSARNFFGCFWLSATFALKKWTISQINKKAEPWFNRVLLFYFG